MERREAVLLIRRLRYFPGAWSKPSPVRTQVLEPFSATIHGRRATILSQLNLAIALLADERSVEDSIGFDFRGGAGKIAIRFLFLSLPSGV